MILTDSRHWLLQIINVPTIQNDTADDGGISTAPVQSADSGQDAKAHPLARAVSYPPLTSGGVSSVFNGQPEPKLKSIIKKTYSNGQPYTESGGDSHNVTAAGDSAQAADYTKQTSVSSKSSVGSDRKGILGRSCCTVS